MSRLLATRDTDAYLGQRTGCANNPSNSLFDWQSLASVPTQHHGLSGQNIACTDMSQLDLFRLATRQHGVTAGMPAQGEWFVFNPGGLTITRIAFFWARDPDQMSQCMFPSDYLFLAPMWATNNPLQANLFCNLTIFSETSQLWESSVQNHASANKRLGIAPHWGGYVKHWTRCHCNKWIAHVLGSAFVGENAYFHASKVKTAKQYACWHGYAWVLSWGRVT